MQQSYDYPADPANCSVGEACARLGLKTFDTALPQQWVDTCADALASEGNLSREERYRAYNALLAFVWGYDDAGCFGRPVALTRAANDTLATLNRIMGTEYPLTETPVF